VRREGLRDRNFDFDAVAGVRSMQPRGASKVNHIDYLAVGWGPGGNAGGELPRHAAAGDDSRTIFSGAFGSAVGAE
jgi:hypothetical protein